MKYLCKHNNDYKVKFCPYSMGETYFQTELLDLNNKGNYRFVIDLLFHCVKPVPLAVKYAYYHEFVPSEKFEEVKKEMNLERKIE